MAFCRYCGRPVEDGQQCNCQAAPAPTPFEGNSQINRGYSSFTDPGYAAQPAPGNGPAAYEVNQQTTPGYREHAINYREKDPFVVKNLKLNFSSVHNFITSFRVQTGVSAAVGNDLDPYEYNVPIVGGNVEPEDNEVVVKQYNIAKLRTRLTGTKAEGRLMVTNRRILFRAAGTSPVGNILQEHQFNLDEVAGIEIHQDNKFSKLNLLFCALLFVLAVFISVVTFKAFEKAAVAAVLGLILGFACWIPLLVVYKHKWLKFLSSSVAIGSMLIPIIYFNLKGSEFLGGFFIFIYLIMFVVYVINTVHTCFEPRLLIRLKVRGGLQAIEIKDAFAGFGDVLPWEDTIIAINELGTLIDDLQKQGDYAISKWSC